MKCIALLAILLCSHFFIAQEYAKLVNPFIGTGGHGHTFPGATAPFGMVQLSPDTRIDGSWDGCGGYHYSDSLLYGFSHTHLSGTGVSDYGDILLLPTTGKTSLLPEEYAVPFSHECEEAEAGYYHTELSNGVKVNLTATARAGFHQYIYPKSTKKGNVLIDLTHRDEVLASSIEIISPTKIRGKRVSKAWANEQHVYFCAEFSEPMTFELFRFGVTIPEKKRSAEGKSVHLIASFNSKKQKTLQIKVGLSQTSMEGAEKNLTAEIDHWDFNRTKKETQHQWNKELSKIQVETPHQEKKKVFYSALYHCMIHPSIANDVDGTYRGRDQQIHNNPGHNYYSVFSLWDTYRALHPLLTIIDKKRTLDFIKTFLLEYQQGGRLPVWELSSCETDCMIGYHSVSVIADAYLKGITDFDTELALEAMLKSANWNHLGLPDYIQYGYLALEHEHESVSKTLEYSYDDWCIARFAKAIGKEKVASEYYIRATNWRNLYDPLSGFIRPRDNGGWYEPFRPEEVNNFYTEANAWQYTFYFPHDVESAIRLMGGLEALTAKLDQLFSTSSTTSGRHQVDITGLIGQYAHGNEPSHHMAYLYAFAKQPWKTQQLVHQILTEFYPNAPNGLIGNEDCGQMSAWYVFSALGFYPVTPGGDAYIIGTPYFDQAKIETEKGTFTLIAKNLSDENKYLQNQKEFRLEHAELETNGELIFEMGSTPDTTTIINSFQASDNLSTKEINMVPSPIIQAKKKIFTDSLLISMGSLNREEMSDRMIMYRVLDSTHSEFQPYTRPFYIDKSSRIEAYESSRATGKDTLYSNSTIGYFHKRPNNYTVQIEHPYNGQYSAGGDRGLVDGLMGDLNWRKGQWQGYQSHDFEVVIDLQENKTIEEVSFGYLQDTRAWIIFPTETIVFTSKDGTNFQQQGSISNSIPATDYNVQRQDGKVRFSPTKARYVKVIAKNYGKLPKWHKGHTIQGDAFIFVDEVTVR